MSTIHLFGNNNNPLTNFGDLEKTIRLNTLMETDFSARDENWISEFLDNLGESNLQLADSEVTILADGFPYMHLKTVSPNENFKAFVIKNELPLLLEKTFGVIINSHHERPDWVLSSGDILNYYLNQEFYTDNSVFSKSDSNIAIGKDEDILVGAPSEAILPLFTRESLREYFVYAGVKNPKVMLIARNYTDEATVSQDLVFNISPAQFASQKDYEDVMKAIAWMLPKHYSFFGVNELEIENGFISL
ncbi:hypothetical protein [Sphingobacterium hungaricum]